ncbi:MAG: hypothetical protein TREMPRED_002533 [Tremellales sp. Tagirdzhanova-0007]|nr:MAG: hypothetical protein TREMPRED_002533 [Tremellales sp. Tagirdzhanova-0007]
MPELPEVERARKLIQDSCLGYKIKKVEAKEDKIVFTGGTTHESFATAIEGRTITGCERKGKTFWMTLSGDGMFPVMHFGMTGMVQLKGQEPTWYRRRPKESATVWPPKYHKLHVSRAMHSVSQETRELAFIDARRLARVRLLPNPVIDHAPVSLLGFDPVLNHPSPEEFKDLIAKKKGTVKGMIMDQAFSAGVGNWVADEILYQARIHPACPVPKLSEQNVKDLHYHIRNVPLIAVGVNADSKHFPEDWLFRWRWGKGKKQTTQAKKAKELQEALSAAGDEDEEDIKPEGRNFLALASQNPDPDGRPATIDFIEVGGRTTAVVAELQSMPEGVEIKPKVSKGGKGSRSKKRKDGDDESGGDMSSTPLSATDGEGDAEQRKLPAKVTTPRQKASIKKKVKVETTEIEEELNQAESAKLKTVQDMDVKAEIATPTKKFFPNPIPSLSYTPPRKSGPSTTSTSRSKGKKASPHSAQRHVGKRGGRGKQSSAASSDLSDAPE